MTQSLTVYRRSELESVRDGCLHRTKAIWEDHADDSSDIANVGVGGHRVKFHYIEKLVAANLEADAELAQAAFVEGVAKAQTPNWLIPEIRQVWERHAENYLLPLDQYVTHEERQLSGNVGFTPDLVTANPRVNELELHDDKWGWMPPMSEDEVRALFQARVYACFARERWPNFNSYRFTIHAIRFNKSTSVVFTNAELDQVELEVRAHIATIEHARATNSWPAVAGPSCRFCTLQCPLMADTSLTVPKRILDAQQAQKMAGFLLAADAMVKAGKKALKAYVSAHGAINLNGVVWDNRESKSRTYPITAVIDAMKARQVPVEYPEGAHMRISHSALKSVFAERPELEFDLQGVVEEKSSYRFSARQAGAEDDDE